MCYENGGTVDDLIIYKKAEDDYLLVVNAANIEKDFNWLQANCRRGCQHSKMYQSDYAQLALQGPLQRKYCKNLLIQPI